MAWESRGGRGRYYTRSRRVGGRVVRQYVGTGPVAELVAEADARQRAARAAARARWRLEREQLEAVEGLGDDLGRTCDRAMRAALEAAGYHQHRRGEWRRKRVRSKG